MESWRDYPGVRYAVFSNQQAIDPQGEPAPIPIPGERTVGSRLALLHRAAELPAEQKTLLSSKLVAGADPYDQLTEMLDR